MPAMLSMYFGTLMPTGRFLLLINKKVEMANDNLPLSVKNQIINFKEKGLSFNDENLAERFLLNNSYYRLKNYTDFFQNSKAFDRYFLNNIFFEDILDIYHFDSELRSLIFNAIEKIEIALRNQIVYQYSITYGSHWYLDSTYFKVANVHQLFLDDLFRNVESSVESFTVPYKQYPYGKQNPPLSSCWMVPACWVAIETVSFGQLSKILGNLKADNCKQAVTLHFGVHAPQILDNWMHCISIIRNICAHHGQLWDRKIREIKLPKNLPNLFIQNKSVENNKIYASICCIQYLLNEIDPENNFKNRLAELLKSRSIKELDRMGFPATWDSELFWI
ncbi:hypothetical protein MsAg5_09380 [Methanosarcinaceae archaeon Ag5]|uniref:Abortive infection bacteriophage resistance protein n=1 Tax=Methanolapillus africanus TaxID=3028297 RepID=A0AAE4MJN5_9EURY|nr:hypothetical protein [Methanosarcinaceae archaeon Ag5]